MNLSTKKMLARAGPILARLPDGSCTFVEVGVNRGQLAEHLLRERPILQWHGVDPWCGRDGHSRAYVATRDGHAVETRSDAERRMRRALDALRPFGRRATVHREASPAATRFFGPSSVNAVFIDGDHSYEGCKVDIEAWWPLVALGGWLGGHDYGNADPRFDFSGVDRAVDAFVANLDLPLELDGGATWFVRKPGA